MIFGFGHCRIWALSAVGPSRIEMANGNSISAGLYTDCELFLYGGWRRSFRGQTIVIDSCKFQQSPPPPPSQRRPLSLSPIQPRVQSLHCPAPNFVSAIPPYASSTLREKNPFSFTIQRKVSTFTYYSIRFSYFSRQTTVPLWERKFFKRLNVGKLELKRG